MYLLPDFIEEILAETNTKDAHRYVYGKFHLGQFYELA
jgi:hypothetical protein